MNDANLGRLTIVTPSFEKHIVQFGHLVESIAEHCLDLDAVHLIAVVERVNQDAFASLLARYPRISSEIVLTEQVLEDFAIDATPGQFLRRVGKFTFQTIKKFGALLRAPSDWSLVLDSEGLFHKPFRALDLLRDYAERKYVFYTRTKPRTDLWRQSTGYDVTKNAGSALAMDSGDRWYMEYFHWFYETEKVRDLIRNRLWASFYELLRNPKSGPIDHFECILYYLYIERYHADEYQLIDLKAEIDALLPPEIARRFNLAELPFSLFGNEYILNILRPEEVKCLRPLFDKYKLAFVRLEPPSFDTRYLPALKALPSFVATISSHHLVWLRKRIAICVSGEFRHAVHRNPELQLRHLVGFLSGVECDVFVHGWSNTSEALILQELKPRAYKFEPRPSLGALKRRITIEEPNIKPGRDEGSLAMFYSIEACYRLLEPFVDDYDFVLRIRPDIFADRSLKEILVGISDEGDYLPDAIYVPQHFHSKGINDQLALGPARQMAVYMQTFSWIEARVEELFFNPETILLRHLVEANVPLAVIPVSYALMRSEPMRIDIVHRHVHEQKRVWWSRTDRLPLYQDVTAFFRDKLKAVDALMRRRVPRVIYFEAPAGAGSGGGSSRAVVRARSVDNDPALVALAFLERFGLLRLARFRFEDGTIRARRDRDQQYLFAFPEADELVLSEWRLHDGKFLNHRLRRPLKESADLAAQDRSRRALAWLPYRIMGGGRVPSLVRGLVRRLARALPQHSRWSLRRD